jgi:hypothetical protein
VSLVEFDLLPEHLEACDWRSVFESCSERDCRAYSHALLAKAAGYAAKLSPSTRPRSGTSEGCAPVC